jgi:ABC-2 type transport system ATP-binding protein
VVLTTQYLEEADRLAAHIVVLDHGRVAARGTPNELKRIVGGKVVAATIPSHHVDALPFRSDTTQRIDGDRVRVSVRVDDATVASALVTQLTHNHIDVSDLDVASPSLDDVVAHLARPGVPA